MHMCDMCLVLCAFVCLFFCVDIRCFPEGGGRWGGDEVACVLLLLFLAFVVRGRRAGLVSIRTDGTISCIARILDRQGHDFNRCTLTLRMCMRAHL